MNQKQIGIIIISIGVLMIAFLAMAKVREESYIRLIVERNNGSCFLEDGTCLHQDRSFLSYIFGGTLSGVLIIFGIYLTFFDKTQKTLAEHQIKVSNALQKAQEMEKSKDEFGAFLSGFNADEQKLLKAIKEQDGITQATLRYRTGISKTQVSLLLKLFEEKGFVTRKPSGKTNQIFLQKKF